ncbi:hypothetical protein N7497_011223 [Penicillium chrysogenum]|nr:hypothetical protein N7497_011223 [Penicillium chrysogenum]
MKLLMITTLLSSLLVSTDATVVKAYKGTACKKDNYIGSPRSISKSPIENGNCVGPRISKNSDQTCVKLPTGWDRFGCVKIHGGTC